MLLINRVMTFVSQFRKQNALQGWVNYSRPSLFSSNSSIPPIAHEDGQTFTLHCIDECPQPEAYSDRIVFHTGWGKSLEPGQIAIVFAHPSIGAADTLYVPSPTVYRPGNATEIKLVTRVLPEKADVEVLAIPSYGDPILEVLILNIRKAEYSRTLEAWDKVWQDINRKNFQMEES